ncbi:hypothetical protein M758_12G154800 [Ceratodon purpureus]|uniref:Uncharacterized protein n=1 Tax=Ceratodon purpureus TaxID=3225 RepID=A0A8T0G7G6_CERPU|nr:hypothetical protein KC19_12G152600 [Ceratodon purpureus]KAG0599479.1 hypothetical protein M758_12G154800 [Ceratodon purpureus]
MLFYFIAMLLVEFPLDSLQAPVGFNQNTVITRILVIQLSFQLSFTEGRRESWQNK